MNAVAPTALEPADSYTYDPLHSGAHGWRIHDRWSRRHRPGKLLFLAASRGRWRWLKLHHREARDTLEVARIAGEHLEAERQRCGSDQQVAEGNHHAPALLLTIQLPGQQRSLFRVRIHGQIGQQFVDERFTSLAYLRGLGAIDTWISSVRPMAESAAS
jgi:hypothetical protein